MALRQLLAQRPTITPQLVLASSLLQLSSMELGQAIAQELAENPALELADGLHCPRCGAELADGRCPTCGPPDRRPYAELARRVYGAGGAPSPRYDISAERDDGTSQLASHAALSEHLLRQVALSLPPEDLPIAAHLVHSLDDHGFLRCELAAVASLFAVDQARVENVVSALQELDPTGVAARDARECLLIQLEHLRREGIEQPLARVVIANHWEALGRRSLPEIARAVGAPVDQVQAALQFIKDNLNPFPAHAYWAGIRESLPEGGAARLRPDVIIGRRPEAAGGGYEIELPAAEAYRLRISASFVAAMEEVRADASSTPEQNWEQWEELLARARLFVKSVEQRWRTLHSLVVHLVEYQGDYLAHGDKHLKPLTRVELADAMGVHESTVSRAVAGKYVQLPSGRIVPLARFFESSVPVKLMIKELVARESRPLTDREIAEVLAQLGHPIARRTVTKYRSELNILPSSRRRHQ
jgi:RNA polymerase sigma-54 factor